MSDLRDPSALDTLEATAMPTAGAPALTEAPRERRLAEGSVLGRYFIVGRLGRGAMGEVLSAYDPELERKVAIKLLHAANGPGLERSRERLVREAQALAKLSHPNIVQVYDVGAVDEHGRSVAASSLSAPTLFIAMELVEGSTLRTWLGQRERNTREVVEAFIQAGRGLEAAHALGMVHRDFKPDNVLVGRDGRVRVVDFGLARAVAVPAERTLDSTPTNERSLELTSQGEIVGTPGYMAPEQLSGELADARADQFAFCAALHEAVYGEPPFTRDSLPALVHAVVSGHRRVPSGVRIPARIERVLARGLAVRPDDRFEAMTQLLAELDHRPLRWPAVALASGLAGSVLVAALVWARADDALARCSRKVEQIHERWGPHSAERLREQILLTKVGYAASTAETVTAELDRFADAWTQMVRDACDATHGRAEQSPELLDLRMECLDDRKRAFDGLLSVLEGADEVVVRNASRALAGLPPVDRCADARALRARVRPPDDPEIARAVKRVQEQVAESHAARDAGLFDRALELAQLASRSAEVTHHEPTIAAALVALGAAEESKGAFTEATEHVYEAALAALRSGDEVAFAEASAWMVWMVGDVQREPALAHAWADLGLAVASRVTVDPRTLYRLHSNRGATLSNESRYDEALREHQTALEIAERTWGPDHERTLVPKMNMATVHYRRGDLERALETYRQGRAVAQARLGPTHPMTLTIRSSIAAALLQLGRLEEAIAEGRETLELHERELGPDHYDVANVAMNLGFSLDAAGRHDEARALLERALSIRERAFGPSSVHLAPLLHALAKQQRRRGDFGEARRLAARALDLHLAAHGPDDAGRGVVLLELGQIALARGDLTEALQMVEAGLDLSQVVKDSQLAGTFFDLAGEIQLAKGDPRAAADSHRKAVESFASSDGNPRDLALARRLLGEALLLAGDRSEAAMELQRAVEAWEAIDGGALETARAQFALARALNTVAGANERALALARQARTTFASVGGDAQRDEEALEAWLRRTAR